MIWLPIQKRAVDFLPNSRGGCAITVSAPTPPWTMRRRRRSIPHAFHSQQPHPPALTVRRRPVDRRAARVRRSQKRQADYPRLSQRNRLTAPRQGSATRCAGGCPFARPKSAWLGMQPKSDLFTLFFRTVVLTRGPL